MKYQRPAVEAIEYEAPDVDILAHVPKNEEENQLRARARVRSFAASPQIKALVKFVKGAKGPTGRKVVLGPTAGWGRDHFVVAVDTPTGTQAVSPGDWLIKDQKTIRVVKADAFWREFGAAK